MPLRRNCRRIRRRGPLHIEEGVPVPWAIWAPARGGDRVRPVRDYRSSLWAMSCFVLPTSQNSFNLVLPVKKYNVFIFFLQREYEVVFYFETEGILLITFAELFFVF
jgi:hypothetical protein